jgi:hypothetical protein
MQLSVVMDQPGIQIHLQNLRGGLTGSAFPAVVSLNRHLDSPAILGYSIDT